MLEFDSSYSLVSKKHFDIRAICFFTCANDSKQLMIKTDTRPRETTLSSLAMSPQTPEANFPMEKGETTLV